MDALIQLRVKITTLQQLIMTILVQLMMFVEYVVEMDQVVFVMIPVLVIIMRLVIVR